jgi:hypothetical protein
MPLVIKDRKVVYRKPTVEEMPKIGKYVSLNPIIQMHRAHAQIRNLSDSMSILQRSLIPDALAKID